MTTVVAAVIERAGPRPHRATQKQRRITRSNGNSPAEKWKPAKRPKPPRCASWPRNSASAPASIARSCATSINIPAGRAILLIFFRVTEFEGEPRNLDFEQVRWESPDRLRDYDFLEGDGEFIRRFSELLNLRSICHVHRPRADRRHQKPRAAARSIHRRNFTCSSRRSIEFDRSSCSRYCRHAACAARPEWAARAFFHTASPRSNRHPVCR